MFKAQAIFAGTVSGPITISTWEINNINELIDNFSKKPTLKG